MERDRVNALLASVGDEPHWQLCRQLLAEYDRAVTAREAWRGLMGDNTALVERLTAELDAANADAAQLAAHVISHPSGDYQQVLDFHDRRIG